MSIVEQMKDRPRLIMAILLLCIPALIMMGTNAVFARWLFPRTIMMSGAAPPLLEVDATPNNPVLPGTQISILVVNQLTKVPVQDAAISVTQQNGTVYCRLTTDSTGYAAFGYPGAPVAVSVTHESYQSAVVIVGIAPVEWYIAAGLMWLGFAILLATVASFWWKNAQLTAAYQALESEFQALRQQVLETKSIAELRFLAALEAENQMKDIGLPNGQAVRELLDFIESNRIDEHFVFGLIIAKQSLTEDIRFDRKIAAFGLTQTFEEILLQLGRISIDNRIQRRFMDAHRPTIGRMLNILVPEGDKKLRAAIKQFGSFNRSLGSQDFDTKLELLIKNDIDSSIWSYGRTLSRPSWDFTIVALVRNYTHHSPVLESRLYNDDVLFKTTIKHILAAIIQAYQLFHTSKNLIT